LLTLSARAHARTQTHSHVMEPACNVPELAF